MDCPKCRLIVPPDAERCDCGYDFATRTVKGSYLNHADPESVGGAHTVPDEIVAELVRAQGRRDVTVGGLVVVAGVLVTAVTYGAASQAGGQYVIAHGAILFGALQLLRGIVRMRTGRPSKFWDVKL